MRICFTSTYSIWDPRSGGGQVSVHNLAVNLTRQGHSVHLICTKGQDVRIRTQPEYDLIWARDFSKRKRSLNAISTLLCVRRLLETRGIDIVHGTGPEATLVGWICSGKTIFVQSVWYPSVPDLGLPNICRSPVGFLRTLWGNQLYYQVRSGVKHASLVTVSSHAIAEQLERKWRVPADKIFVFPPGIDDSFFDCKRERTINGDVILFVGRLEPQKGVDVLLKALPRVLNRRSVRVQIVGSGSGEGQYKKLARELGVEEKVHFMGKVSYEDVPRFLAGASLFVLPSRSEGFGGVLIEAMAARVPVVATAVGAVPEVVCDGQTGILVPPENPVALAEAITALLEDSDKRKRLGEAGRQMVTERFTWEKVAEQLAIEYTKLLAQRE